MPLPRLILLFLIAFLVGADEFLLGPILTPIGSDLGVPPERVVLFVAAYSLPLALLAPIFGNLSDRFGRVTVLAPASLVFAIASIATSLVNSFELGLLTRVVTGAASAGMLPVAFALAGDEGEAKGAKAIAVVTSGLTLGIILSPSIGALATQYISWRSAFAGLGVLALPIALFGFLSRKSMATKTSALPDDGQLFVPGAIGALIAMGLGLGGAIGMFALVGERLRDQFELGTGTIGLIYAGFGLLTFAGNFLMPSAVRLFGSGRRIMRVALCFVLVAIVVIYALDIAPLILVCAALAAWALLGGVGAPALQTHIAALSAERRGTLMAFAMSAMNLGVAAATGLASLAYGVSAVWVAVLAIALLCAAIVSLMPVSSTEKEGAAPS
ncbi:MFS transporter [Pararhizobium sp. IMCC21322]|uniref:MFS transporter n=1 Tax=Pararhizobium sp. IMCC21322 TaxID=3067903 RepID=UPI0027423516|nr:MFS transporter [Pararhizobium sp. IMCC21322]